jgi:hypothetical protein
VQLEATALLLIKQAFQIIARDLSGIIQHIKTIDIKKVANAIFTLLISRLDSRISPLPTAS